MPTLREFFTTEAAEFISQLNAAVQKLEAGAGNPADLQRGSRGLRGSAQMAREDRVYRAAVGLESAARSVAAGALSWSEDMATRVRRTLEDIEALVRGGESDDEADSRVKRTLDRWREAGVALPDQQPSAAGAQQMSDAGRQFRQFAAHEVVGIIAEMDVSIETLAAEPRNRDPLKAILRRERALLGAARLDEIGAVAEALRATEDITRVIAKVNAPVKDEWLNVFRAAREVLKAAHAPLQAGETPGPTPALSKLRVMRQELMDRYGQGEPVNPVAGTYTAPPAPAPVAPAPVTPAPVTPAPVTPAPAPSAPASPAPTQTAPVETPAPAPTPAPEVVSIESLQYDPKSALKRALELQPQLQALALQMPAARDAVDELFDLIRLGAS